MGVAPSSDSPGSAARQLAALPGDSITRTYLNLHAVRTIQSEPKTGKHDYHRLLFMLPSIRMWNRLFVQEAL